MAPVSGTAGSVVIIPGGTAVVGKVREWSINITHNTNDVTAMGMSWREHIAGLREWDGSMMLVGDVADTPQGTVRSRIIGGSAPFLCNFSDGTATYAGSAIPTKFSPKLTYDGILEISVDFKGSGPITYT